MVHIELIDDTKNGKSGVSITLVMIMKNESAILQRCLDSLLPIIDYVVVTDTGSTDSSIEIVEKYLLDHPKLDGKVYQDPWKNFGYNRTQSVLNAQSWMKENGIGDRKNNYILTIDCDMKLQIDASFKKEDLLGADSWLLQQINPFVSYYNMRIFNSTLPYRCCGVTHEYWECKRSENERELVHKQLNTLKIDDVGDGGSKADKFTRDIRLLREALGEPTTDGVEIQKDLIEPNEELRIRYYFYLAQSYNDTEQVDLAIKWYNIRIAAKGWVEELFISYLRLGELHERKGEIALAVSAWSMGYQILPERTESLHRIIRMYRMQGHHHIACVYLKEAIHRPFPEHHLLFVEHQIYQFRLIEELSVVGFYTNQRAAAFAAVQYLQLYPTSFGGGGVPPELKNICVQNTPHFLIPLQRNKHTTLSIEGIDPIYKNSSSSLFKANGEYYGTVRAVNYSIGDQFQYTVRDPQQIVRTKNYWYRAKGNGQIISIHELSDQHLPKVRTSHIDGLEDLKITWITPTQPIGIAVDWERGKHNHPSMVLVHFEKKGKKFALSKVVPIEYGSEECQKNWSIFSEGGKLYSIYSHYPLLILEINPDTGTSKEYIRRVPPLDLSLIRGSSNPVKDGKDNWMVLVHEVSQQHTRVYYHRFLKYDKYWNLIGVSYPFYFEKLFVEFSLSIIYEKGTLAATPTGGALTSGGGIVSIVYSTRDNTTEIIEVEEDKIPCIPFGVPMDPRNLYKQIQLEMKK